MTLGGAAAGRDAGIARAPWPNAAERATARRTAEDALARSRIRRAARARPDTGADGAGAEAEEGTATGAGVPLTARPRVEDDTALLGVTRFSHSRLGQRVFTLFFVFVFVLIAVQMVVALLTG